MCMFNSEASYVKIKLKFHLKWIYSFSSLEASQERSPNVWLLKALTPYSLNLHSEMAGGTSFECSRAVARLMWMDKQMPQIVH